MPELENKEPASTGKKKILIVEDERPLAHALELKLSNSGYETNIVSTGKDAIEEASNKEFDLILLDLIIPGVDGFQVLEELHKKKLKIPIVVLSNLGQAEDQKRAEKFGVTKYCVKANTPLATIVDTIKSIVK